MLLQTLPFSRLADRIIAASHIEQRRGSTRSGLGGAVLGGVIGSMLDNG